MGERGPVTRFRIERASVGYRVVGPGLLAWEPTLGEAVAWRDALEAPGWCYPIRSCVACEPSAPFESVVYGPVTSRRLGRSLGLNLSPPGRRACTFACAYCPYAKAPARRAGSRWPTPEEVRVGLAEALGKAGALDSITISGHGEPTLHPQLPEVVERVLGAARQARPGLPGRILTNGSRAGCPEARQALDRLDERIVKLDADPQRVCRPARKQPLGAMLLGIALLRDVTVQSCFIDGAVSNTGESAIRDWLGLVSEVAPRAVQIYTIDRAPAGVDIRPVAAAHLEEIACRLRAQSGIEARVYA